MHCGYRAWNRRRVARQTELSGELTAGEGVKQAPGGGAFALGLQAVGQGPGGRQALLAEGRRGQREHWLAPRVMMPPRGG